MVARRCARGLVYPSVLAYWGTGWNPPPVAELGDDIEGECVPGEGQRRRERAIWAA